MVFASVRFSSPLPVAVARTSQSPCSLSAILYRHSPKHSSVTKNYNSVKKKYENY